MGWEKRSLSSVLPDPTTCPSFFSLLSAFPWLPEVKDGGRHFPWNASVSNYSDINETQTITKLFLCRELSLAIRSIQEYAMGGAKYDRSEMNTANSLGAASDIYSDYQGEEERRELKSRGLMITVKSQLLDEISKQMGEHDVNELSEDEDEYPFRPAN